MIGRSFLYFRFMNQVIRRLIENIITLKKNKQRYAAQNVEPIAAI